MKNFQFVTAVLLVLSPTKARLLSGGGNGGGCGTNTNKTLTLAAYGDWPYKQILLDQADMLVSSVNGDSDVEFTIHLGDIRSGSMPCTGAGMDQTGVGVVSHSDPASYSAVNGTSKINPLWNIHVFKVFQQFTTLVYTPGDNEWTDCHKKKQLISGAPLAELAGVRELFFSQPGYSLGQDRIRVTSQPEIFPQDAPFVENVMWMDTSIVFATYNMPGGSNNDADQWTFPFTNDSAQNNERIARDAANLRWLQATFDLATANKAGAIVLNMQADMWDTENGKDHLSNYSPFVQKLAGLCVNYQRPVLLLNGDSHIFKADQPLMPTNGIPVTPNCNSTTQCDISTIHQTGPVPNFYRVVVWGSNEPTSNGKFWLKLQINPAGADGPSVFSWTNVQYAPP
jgi:hypothetical protein